MCIRLIFPDVDASKQIRGSKNPALWHKSINHRSNSLTVDSKLLKRLFFLLL